MYRLKVSRTVPRITVIEGKVIYPGICTLCFVNEEACLSFMQSVPFVENIKAKTIILIDTNKEQDTVPEDKRVNEILVPVQEFTPVITVPVVLSKKSRIRGLAKEGKK